MVPAIPARLRMLRTLLAMDATILIALGAFLIGMPSKVAVAFGFHDLGSAALYLIGMWGCALASLGIGSAFAAGDPVRNVAWVRAGIIRGTLECALGFLVIARHAVTWNQAAFGTVLAGAIAVGYLLLYPREAV